MATVKVSLYLTPKEADVVRWSLERLVDQAKIANEDVSTQLSVAGRYASRMLMQFADFRNAPIIIREDGEIVEVKS